MAASRNSQADIGVALLRLVLSPASSSCEGESAAAVAFPAESKHSSQEVLDVPGPARPSRSSRASHLSDITRASVRSETGDKLNQIHASNPLNLCPGDMMPVPASHECESPRHKIDEAPRPQFVAWEAQHSYDECYPESDEPMQVHIILDGSSRMSLDMISSDRVIDLKNRVCKAMDKLPLQCLRLKLSDMLLTADDEQLCFAGISDGSELTATITPMQVTRHIFCQRLHAYAGAESMHMFDHTDAVFLDPNMSLQSQSSVILPEGAEIQVLNRFPNCNIAALMWRQDAPSEVESFLRWKARRQPPSSWEYAAKGTHECSAVRVILSKTAKEYFGSGRTDLVVLVPSKTYLISCPLNMPTSTP
eukprot:TRINITY_DN25530_c0_g1_i1.p1 TRINITY_DN25530_c0_g1~~TRINITY_DN25530_c0_g1_i1.p1  ORF type:complete len:363 (+),score=35.46 TRINITY_DN25530_c0_g1_i1:91-1179(+)